MERASRTRGAWIEDVLTRYERPLVAYARRLVADESRAERITEDALRALGRRPCHPRDPRLAPRLYRDLRSRAPAAPTTPTPSEALWLRAYAGLRPRRIAQVFGGTTDGVERTLRSALRRLRPGEDRTWGGLGRPVRPRLGPESRARVVAAATAFPPRLWTQKARWGRVAAAVLLTLGLVAGARAGIGHGPRTAEGAGANPTAPLMQIAEAQFDVVYEEDCCEIEGVALSDHVETDNDIPFEESLGEDGIADAPYGGPANNGLLGTGGGAGGTFDERSLLRRRVEDELHAALPPFDAEGYDATEDNPFFRTSDRHTSTFSADVDTASYANVRRFLLREHRLPPRGAVRIEELVNYFRYDYDPPEEDSEHPFAYRTAVATCPWEPSHRLVRIALRGKALNEHDRPPANLVFLLDVSGSMDEPDKLPLVQRALRLLVGRLEARDRVALVVYAGAAGLVLPSTSASEKAPIYEAIDRLEAGGSTNGGEGLQLAYDVATRHRLEDGVNRVVLCTDGDFNVGISDRSSLVELIEERAKTGVFLSVLGFGRGNYKDDRMEELSNKGNGNYAYVDTLREARKVLVEEGVGTLVTIAKDVKVQVNFNPATVKGWRLIGYENRVLRSRDFNDDAKDAGEIGAGHEVTALYEVVPADGVLWGSSVDPNPFVIGPGLPLEDASDALLRLRLRYKAADAEVSTLMEEDVFDDGLELEEADAAFQWATAVAGFGMLLRASPHRGQCSWALVEELAQGSRGDDRTGYRTEFLSMVERAAALSPDPP